MTLVHKAWIDAAPAEVWPWVADPMRVGEWNPKLVSIDRESSGELATGDTYTVLYRMNGRDSEFDAVVRRSEPPYRLEIELREPGAPRDRVIVESYRLEDREAGTRLVQRIDLSHAGIAWPWRLLMSFLTRFGTPKGKPYLLRLRELVEESV
ncbi:MAG: SRPBCC family protein [Acidobacteria bacterium]|nr:SRPBCC family protein [Acidobacteriota bacterium]